MGKNLIKSQHASLLLAVHQPSGPVIKIGIVIISLTFRCWQNWHQRLHPLMKVLPGSRRTAIDYESREKKICSLSEAEYI